MIEQAYKGGVPMGGVLDASDARFLVSAVKDAGSPGLPGTDLQRLQIIKGWVDAEAIPTRKSTTWPAAPAAKAWVDEQSCAVTGSGAPICTVWQDPDFDAGQDAFYTFAPGKPSCRWVLASAWPRA